jgi:hypothetical protein
VKKEVRTTTKAVGRKKESILMKTKIRNSISGLFFIPLLLCGFALFPSVQAAPDPSPPPGNNTRDGAGSMAHITSGTGNTAFGTNALNSLTTGDNNAAQGNSALFSCTDGNGNTAVGSIALRFLTTGDQNVAIGNTALNNITTGNRNTAVGYAALKPNAGNDNTAVGFSAGFSHNTGNNNIYIGDVGANAESNVIAIGNVPASGTDYVAFFTGGISGVAVSGAAVVVAADGQLGVAASSARFKEQIKPMDKASETILALKPVTFRYKKGIDSQGIPQFGLVAEDVEKVNPDLVSRDEEGKAFAVRYEAVNAMLLNEFLKEHRKVQEQDATISQLKQDFRATVAELNARLKEQDSKIEKVSAQLEVSKSAPQVVVDSH